MVQSRALTPDGYWCVACCHFFLIWQSEGKEPSASDWMIRHCMFQTLVVHWLKITDLGAIRASVRQGGNIWYCWIQSCSAQRKLQHIFLLSEISRGCPCQAGDFSYSRIWASSAPWLHHVPALCSGLLDPMHMTSRRTRDAVQNGWRRFLWARPRCDAHDFCLLSTGQNSVTWPHLAAKESGK